jgi:hypothetical protein
VVEVEEEEAAVGLIFEVWPTFRATLYEGDKEYRVAEGNVMRDDT